jgi:hypothetical protein
MRIRGNWRLGSAFGTLAGHAGLNGTISAGPVGEFYVGPIHVQVGFEVAVGLGSDGFSAGVVGTGGVQPGVGLGASVGVSGTVTNADNVSALRGSTTTVGISTPIAGADYLAGVGGTYQGVSVNAAPWWTTWVFGIHAGDLNSLLWQWW